VRSTIFAVGLCATALISLQALILLPFPFDNPANVWQVIVLALTGAAIAGPLFGTIAGTRQDRWKPLLTGCALGGFILIVMVALLQLAE
jgi:uncharacterized membrane protein YeaQ/YmgE (transglycosylase-associated protein family)